MRQFGFLVVAILLASGLLLDGLWLGSSPHATAGAAPLTVAGTLSGPGEDPPNDSTGTGSTRVTFDPIAHTLSVQITFSGMASPTTASHIHACTAAPLTGTAAVATQLPRFTDFPTDVTSGSYSRTFDTLDPATYNPAFVTANGGTAAGAEVALATCMASGQSYLNIHSTQYPAGEIRAFLTPV